MLKYSLELGVENKCVTKFRIERFEMCPSDVLEFDGSIDEMYENSIRPKDVQ